MKAVLVFSDQGCTDVSWCNIDEHCLKYIKFITCLILSSLLGIARSLFFSCVNYTISSIWSHKPIKQMWSILLLCHYWVLIVWFLFLKLLLYISSSLLKFSMLSWIALQTLVSFFITLLLTSLLEIIIIFQPVSGDLFDLFCCLELFICFFFSLDSLVWGSHITWDNYLYQLCQCRGPYSEDESHQ